MRWPRSPKVIAGIVILGVFVLLTVIGPWIAPYTPNSSLFVPNQGPSAAHLLGTTALGQDILSQLLVGARATMVVGLVAGLAATALSVIVGVTAGYLGGTADDGLSLASNVFLAIPGLPLLIVIDSYLPQSARSNSLLIGAVIALTGWAWGARVLRALTMSLRNRDFVEASRIIGEGRLRIILSEVVPNVLPVIASSFLFTMLYSIGIFVALAYLGVTSTSVWNWGTMLYWAQSNNAPLVGQWWWFVPPGLCIAFVGMGLALVNFGIDEFIDPRLRGGGLSGRMFRRTGLSRHPKIGFTPVLSGGGADRMGLRRVPAARAELGAPPGTDSGGSLSNGTKPAGGKS
jgi:peptide/nickel transport system permease protein